MATKLIGLLLGDEEDWPTAFEALARRLNPSIKYRRRTYQIDIERIRIHPFNLRTDVRYDVVIDRLAYWHYNPREWLKKAALVNDVYLLNNPFTFQSMEKHSAYCAMIRLGLKIPDTWLIPPKVGPDSPKYSITASKYHDWFDLKAIARQIGYPLFMKPFDGGGWRGVSMIRSSEELTECYDNSGRMLMHLQAGLDDYDAFVRSLGIGPLIMSFNYDPDQPMHARYQIDHQFLSPDEGEEARIITKLINAFFRWDFNSCEAIVQNGALWPIDFANACPDIALTSLHYYFPWAIKSLMSWSVFCAITERKMRINMDVERYFRVARSDRSYREKLDEYEVLADRYFQTPRFEEFRATHFKNLDEAMWDYIRSHEFDDLLTRNVQETFPPHEHDQFIAHYRGLMQHWVDAESNPA